MSVLRRPSRPTVPKPAPSRPTPTEEDLFDPALPPTEPADEDVGPRQTDDHDELYVRDEHGGTDDAAAGDLDIGELVGDDHTVSHGDSLEGLPDEDAEPALFDEVHGSLMDDGPAENDHHELLHDALPSSPDDGGAEGTSDGTEGELHEDQLPELDADAEGELELDEMLKQLGFASEGGETWEQTTAFGFDRALACVVASDGSVAAAGEALVVIGRGEIAPRSRPLADAASACAWLGPRVLFATARGVHVAEGSGPDVLAIALPNVQALAVAAGRAWALAQSTLYAIDARTNATEVARTDVAQISSSPSALYLVAGTGADARVLALRAQDGDWQDLGVAPEPLEHLGRGARLVTSAAGAVATIDSAQTLVWRPGATRSTAVPLDDVVAAVFCGDGPHAPLLLATESGSLSLFEEGRGLSEVGSAPFAPVALTWDATRDLAFAVGPSGLVALGPRVKH